MHDLDWWHAGSVHHDVDRCYRAVQARDARFDGWFVTAVHSTGIYCRPSCPARTPLARNVSFHPTAAAAQRAGFRACKRCRPDATPGSPEWNVRTDVAARAMRLIADGTVDREGVNGLASRLGYSSRQLERVLLAEVGAGPLALARAQRAQTARLLLETTDLPVTEVAFAAGFASIRQFNDTVRHVFDTSPSGLRARKRRGASTSGVLVLRLPFRLPFDPSGVFGHLAATAVPGCEEVRDGALRTALRLPGGNAIASLTPRADHISCRLRLDDVRDLPSAIARCRRLLDLDADPVAVMGDLATDQHLRPSLTRVPGRRIPRSVDEAETALRVVLGQHVSLRRAQTLAGRLTERHGTPVEDPDGGLTHSFPTPEVVAGIDPAELGPGALGLPSVRQRCLSTVAARLADGTIALDPGSDWEQARSQLAIVPGMGPWSCEMIAMRALGDPDAFPASDAGLLRGAGGVGAPTSADALGRHSMRWRPWRSYAVQYIWGSLDGPASRWPPEEDDR